MSKTNPLAGLIGNYGDSDEDSDDAVMRSSSTHSVSDKKTHKVPAATGLDQTSNIAGIHPAPIAHCPWSACYDESSGFTYYWNQKTNAVTWEAPPEYLLALKIAQQHLNTSGSTEVSAEEWQLYQQALAEKQNSQNKVIAKAAIAKSSKKPDKPSVLVKDKKSKGKKKRPVSDDDEEKIELITSYHNSDSESNDEAETPVTVQPQPKVTKAPAKVLKNPHKKLKTKPQVVEYGPTMPPNMNYTVPIGPELPPNMKNETVPKSPEKKKMDTVVVVEKEEKKPSLSNDNEDSQDENILLKKLKDKARLLEKLGGELPSELQQMINDETTSITASPKSTDTNKATNLDIDDLLQEIEEKEFPKVKSKTNTDSKDSKSDIVSASNSPRSDGSRTPPLEELKSLFPSSKNIAVLATPALFPSAVNVEEPSDVKPESPQPKVPEKKENMYLMDANEPIENVNRKKLRISNSVLPERKTVENKTTPAYTTKYSQFIEGFSTERTGLGFSKEENGSDSPKNTISYGNGLTFTKGETLNEEKADDELSDMTDLIEAKLKYLNELQASAVTPVQEMFIQLQTLISASNSGALRAGYLSAWARGAGAALARHEAAAAPAGWSCAFLRSEGRYRYRREADGLEQWEYPARDDTDMDISTTPPHPGIEPKEELPSPQLVQQAPLLPPAAARSLSPSPCGSPAAPPPGERGATPPPPAWPEPPPPGCDEPPPLPPEPKKEIGDELMSFYSDIAELEKQSGPNTASNSPEPPPPPEIKDYRAKDKDAKTSKKKSKVKISASMGLKHKSVSTLVAKWQQVAEEITSD
ncbi:unnamed protein product [Parnassius mnemosyne]|uniref:WW domain-containing protein n=1 Tax=Parnassius mnemosyne TaxID=213953 RepID=A0AAV1KV59_9NEOP